MTLNSQERTVTNDELAGAAERERVALASLEASLPARLESYLGQHAAWPTGWSYGRIPAPVQSTIAEVRALGGQHFVAAFHRAAICAGLRETRSRIAAHARWPHSLPYFDDAASRIIEGLAGTPDEELDYPNDAFAKDIALATGRMWHAKAQLVEPRLGIARGRIARSGSATVLRAVALLAKMGGHAPLYEIHTYHHLLHWFSEEGWADCYRAIAQALLEDRFARGVFGTAWFFDPALSQVSPRLGYLYQFPAERGGVFLKVSNSPSGVRSALSKSDTRRRLYDEGKYRPQEYLLVWPRDAMIAWLRSGGS